MKKSHRSDSQSAFTLIELLVVIAIIALLLSLTSSVISKTLEKSRRAACASNLRGLAQGLIVYATDHKGFFPDYAENSNSWPWAGEWAVIYSNFYDDYVNDPMAYYCPSDLKLGTKSEGARSQPYFPEKPPYELGWRRNISYNYYAGMNAWKKDRATRDSRIKTRNRNGNDRGGYQNIGDIPNASTSTLMADIMQLGRSVPDLSNAVTTNWNHAGKTYSSSGGNIGYSDGHVSWFNVTQELPDEYARNSGSRQYINHQSDK